MFEAPGDATVLADWLKDAGWSLYDAALCCADTKGQTAAFDAATKVADQLEAVGRVVQAQELRKVIKEF